MKGTDNILDTDLPVLSHLTYNEWHVFLLGVLIGVGSSVLHTLDYTGTGVLVNVVVLLALLGFHYGQETRMLRLIRKESWYYLAGLLFGSGVAYAALTTI